MQHNVIHKQAPRIKRKQGQITAWGYFLQRKLIMKHSKQCRRLPLSWWIAFDFWKCWECHSMNKYTGEYYFLSQWEQSVPSKPQPVAGKGNHPILSQALFLFFISKQKFQPLWNHLAEVWLIFKLCLITLCFRHCTASIRDGCLSRSFETKDSYKPGIPRTCTA